MIVNIQNKLPEPAIVITSNSHFRKPTQMCERIKQNLLALKMFQAWTKHRLWSPFML